jgi:hypothetical protein
MELMLGELRRLTSDGIPEHCLVVTFSWPSRMRSQPEESDREVTPFSNVPSHAQIPTMG